MPLLNTESNLIILASKSPRRVELLKKIISHFQVKVSNVDENFNGDLSPQQLAVTLSKLKAENISTFFENGIVVGADSIVVLEDLILGKPKDPADAFKMLSGLSGKTHQVITGFTVIQNQNQNQNIVSDYEVTDVKFRDLSAQEIKKYIETNNPFDKAGSYGIQDEGGIFVDKINGCYFNVMGLPITRLYLVLKEMID